MPILLLKLKDGTVLKGQYPIHAIMADELNVNFDDIIDVGVITKNREIWCNRKPH